MESRLMTCFVSLVLCANNVLAGEPYSFRESQAYASLSNADQVKLEQAHRDLMMLWGALDLYADGHKGNPPESLDDLVPHYLRELPVDPFTIDETESKGTPGDRKASKGAVGYRYRKGAAGQREWSLSSVGTARQIAGLALYSLVNAAMERQRKGLPLRHTFVFVDEFQELAGPSFSRLLSQSAKYGITLICANQTTSQLKNAGTDLADTVRDNTLLKIYFTVTGKDDIEEIQTFSKDDPNYYLANEGGFGRESQRQVIVPKLKKDGILDASATSQDAFVIFDEGRHREPTPVHFDFSTDADSYRNWKRLPLPLFEGTRDSTPAADPDAPTEPRWKTLRGDELSKAHQYAIDRILQRKIAAERPNDE